MSDRSRSSREAAEMVSIVGPGMKLKGDCSTEGTLRVEGRVEGTVRAAKAVVIGEDGLVVGDVHTQDAVVAGTVRGTIDAGSRVELQSGCRVEGDIRARRVKLEEGGFVEGRIEMGRKEQETSVSPQASSAQEDRPGGRG